MTDVYVPVRIQLFPVRTIVHTTAGVALDRERVSTPVISEVTGDCFDSNLYLLSV